MKNLSITASSPGKVLISGGYLILDSNSPLGLVLSTSSRFFSTISTISSSLLPLSKDIDTCHSKGSIHVLVESLQFRTQWRYLLSTRSETVGKNFNIALGLENSIEKMANLLRKKCRRDSAKFMGRHRPGDPERWVANIESLKALGFSAKFDLEAGLENTLAWVREIPCD